MLWLIESCSITFKLYGHCKWPGIQWFSEIFLFAPICDKEENFIWRLFTWKSHINELCLKLSKTVGILSKVRYYVSKHIHYSLIYPFLTYGVHVWGLTFPTFLTQLFIIQKRALRIISFSEPKSHCEPLFKSLNLFKLNDVIESQILSFVYQLSHGLLPPVSVNISILHLRILFIHMQQGNHVIEIC